MAGNPLSPRERGHRTSHDRPCRKRSISRAQSSLRVKKNMMTGVLIDHEAGVGDGLVHGLRFFDRGDRRLAGMEDKGWYFDTRAQVGDIHIGEKTDNGLHDVGVSATDEVGEPLDHLLIVFSGSKRKVVSCRYHSFTLIWRNCSGQ